MTLKQKFDTGEFAIIAEMEPPKGVDVSRMLADAKRVKGSVDAFLVPEMSNAVTVENVSFAYNSQKILESIDLQVEKGEVIAIVGPNGGGKTTLLNILSGFIPDDERIVTVENAAELQLRQEHVVTLESRPPNIEGKGEITQRNLVRNSLRMRPDRIIVGEVRGQEALDMLQAMAVQQVPRQVRAGALVAVFRPAVTLHDVAHPPTGAVYQQYEQD